MKRSFETKIVIQKTIENLLDYCRNNNWAGYDPYDGLNSKIFQNIPFAQNRICRLVLIQSMKRSPINFRRLIFVPKGENPKGLAVFLSALLLLSKAKMLKTEDDIHHLLRRLTELKSPNQDFWCWGYNFDWQYRDGFLPRFVPNIISTTFAGSAMIDAYEIFNDSKYLSMAKSAADFLLNGLNIKKNGDEICFSYTPLSHDQVHNANLLGAAYLARIFSMTGEKTLLEPILGAVRYSARRQNEDGSWAYGEDKTQVWVDNFHTGYNLCALRNIGRYLDTNEFEPHIRLGYQFYRKHFFRGDGAPKYFHNRAYPIDIHSVAQSLITLVSFRDIDDSAINLADAVFEWTIANMWNGSGYFYYQVTPYYKNRISYMRWSQAWMLLALTTLFDQYRKADDQSR